MSTEEFTRAESAVPSSEPTPNYSEHTQKKMRQLRLLIPVAFAGALSIASPSFGASKPLEAAINSNPIEAKASLNNMANVNTGISRESQAPMNVIDNSKKLPIQFSPDGNFGFNPSINLVKGSIGAKVFLGVNSSLTKGVDSASLGLQLENTMQVGEIGKVDTQATLAKNLVSGKNPFDFKSNFTTIDGSLKVGVVGTVGKQVNPFVNYRTGDLSTRVGFTNGNLEYQAALVDQKNESNYLKLKSNLNSPEISGGLETGNFTSALKYTPTNGKYKANIDAQFDNLTLQGELHNNGYKADIALSDPKNDSYRVEAGVTNSSEDSTYYANGNLKIGDLAVQAGATNEGYDARLTLSDPKNKSNRVEAGVKNNYENGPNYSISASSNFGLQNFEGKVGFTGTPEETIVDAKAKYKPTPNTVITAGYNSNGSTEASFKITDNPSPLRKFDEGAIGKLGDEAQKYKEDNGVFLPDL